MVFGFEMGFNVEPGDTVAVGEGLSVAEPGRTQKDNKSAVGGGRNVVRDVGDNSVPSQSKTS
jgi:hypothetical protein